MNILLVYRNSPLLQDDYHAMLMPVGLPLMAALLRREGHDARVANFSGLSTEEMSGVLRSFRPAMVGVSQLTHNRHEAFEVAARVKSVLPDSLVVFGGPHATFCHDDVLGRHGAVDLVVLGEGEETLLALVRALEAGVRNFAGIDGVAVRSGGGILITPRRKRGGNLDGYPPALDGLVDSFHVNPRRQAEFIITSRGCPARCSFCSSPSFWSGGLHFRSAASMLAEVEALRERYGLLYLSIRDDTFTTDRQRVLDFCRGLLERGLHIMWNCQSRVAAVDRELLLWMRRAGCECIQFGIESGSPAILAALGKGATTAQVLTACRQVREVGIQLALYLISGVPGETDTDIDMTVDLLRRVRPHEVQVSPLAYYPGTPLFINAVKEGLAPADLFVAEPAPGLYVCSEEGARRRHARLRALAEGISHESSYSPAEQSAQRDLVGYSCAGSLTAGEYWTGVGEVGRAEESYREICRQQPDNPWGWLALGELLGEAGRFAEAERALRRVTELVPNHAPAYTLMGEMALCRGQRQAAASLFSQVLSLDPYDRTAAGFLNPRCGRGGKGKRAKP